MNTKKIWVLAMIFGIIAAGLMYALIIENKQAMDRPITESSSAADEENESALLDDALEEEQRNELIPVTKGNRAMTVAVSDVEGVAGFIEPGNFVDVVVIMTVPEDQKDRQHDAATLLLQNVKVLAIGHGADDAETMKRYQMVTLEVTPHEGLTLSFATQYELHLLLRGEGDQQIESDRTHVHEDELHEGVFKQK